MPWYVLYTKPKNEKKVAEQLQSLGFEVFCPLITVFRQWSDRKKKIQTPLFHSCVFVHTTNALRAQVFQVPGAVRYLFWLGKPAIVKDQEITTLREWLSQDYKNISTGPYTPGEKIAIPLGPFAGQAAVVKDFRGKKLRLQLEVLGIEIVMET
jgi:transcription antitermination factor NusG